MSRTASRAATSSAPQSRKPTPAELRAAAGKRLKDVLAPGLRVLFCGINPGLYSAATGHHFARPGNRFWPALHGAGFTPRLLHPSEKREILRLGFGLTNLVERATAAADELAAPEFEEGALRLASKVRRTRPRIVAFLGLGAYRHAFARPKATFGRQEETLEGAEIWVLPSPSGLNANYQLADLVQLFRKLKRAACNDHPGETTRPARQRARQVSGGIAADRLDQRPGVRGRRKAA